MKAQAQSEDLHWLLDLASAELSRRRGRAPSASELAAELGVGREDVIAALIAAWSCESPPTDRSGRAGGDDLRLLEALAAFDRDLEKLSDREAVRQVLSGLPESERVAVLLRFFGAMTQTQIARYLGVSQMQVTGLLAASLGRLRDCMR